MLDGVDLGPSTLDIGPGYGANIVALRGRTTHLTVAEADPALAAHLAAQGRRHVRVLHADGTDLPLPDA